MQFALAVQEDTSAMASMVSLINIESLFSLLSISLIFRFDFSLTIELTFDWIGLSSGTILNLKKRKYWGSSMWGNLGKYSPASNGLNRQRSSHYMTLLTSSQWPRHGPSILTLTCWVWLENKTTSIRDPERILKIGSLLCCCRASTALLYDLDECLLLKPVSWNFKLLQVFTLKLAPLENSMEYLRLA